MPSPAFGSAGAIAAAAGAGTTQVDVPYPAGLVAGDVLILWGLTRDNLDLTASEFTAGDSRNQTTNMRGEWWWKRADGTETGTTPITRTSASTLLAGVMARYTGGVESGTPFEAAAQTGLGNNATWTPADITTLGADRLALALACAGDDLLTAGNYTGGTATVTERVDVETGLGTDGTLHAADAPVAAASTFDYGSQTTAAAHAHALFSFALLPAVGGAEPSRPLVRVRRALIRVFRRRPAQTPTTVLPLLLEPPTPVGDPVRPWFRPRRTTPATMVARAKPHPWLEPPPAPPAPASGPPRRRAGVYDDTRP